MAPSASQDLAIHPSTKIKDVASPLKTALPLPSNARARLETAGIDLSDGYPTRPGRPLYREISLPPPFFLAITLHFPTY